MKALRSANAQTTLSKRQQEQQAKIKKIAIAILIAILIFLALLMLESNLISDETYTYVLTSNSYISAGTVVNEDNYNTLFSSLFNQIFNRYIIITNMWKCNIFIHCYHP